MPPASVIGGYAEMAPATFRYSKLWYHYERVTAHRGDSSRDEAQERLIVWTIDAT